MKILITGSNGFIAQHIIALLIKNKDFEVIGTSRKEDLVNWNKETELYSFYKADVTESEGIEKIKESGADIIIHAAAMGSADECELNKERAYKINVEATEKLALVANNIGAKLIFLSSDFVFSGKDGRRYNESDKMNPVNYYGYTKMEAENILIKNCNDHCIIRLCSVYGKAYAGNARGIVTLTRRRLAENKEINVVDDQHRTPTYVEDIANAVEGIIAKNAKGTYHVSGEEEYTPYEMALATAKYFKLNDKLINRVTTEMLNEPAQRPLYTGFHISKAKKDFDFKPTLLIYGIQKMLL